MAEMLAAVNVAFEQFRAELRHSPASETEALLYLAFLEGWRSREDYHG